MPKKNDPLEVAAWVKSAEDGLSVAAIAKYHGADPRTVALALDRGERERAVRAIRLEGFRQGFLQHVREMFEVYEIFSESARLPRLLSVTLGKDREGIDDLVLLGKLPLRREGRGLTPSFPDPDQQAQFVYALAHLDRELAERRFKAFLRDLGAVLDAPWARFRRDQAFFREALGSFKMDDEDRARIGGELAGYLLNCRWSGEPVNQEETLRTQENCVSFRDHLLTPKAPGPAGLNEALSALREDLRRQSEATPPIPVNQRENLQRSAAALLDELNAIRLGHQLPGTCPACRRLGVT